MSIEAIRVHYGGPGTTLVEVDAEGSTGIGLTQSAYEYISPIIESGPHPLANILLGQDPRLPRRLWTDMFRGFGAAKGRGSESGLATNAMAALDMALWDLAGKLLEVPLHLLLGGAVKDSIRAYASSSLFLSSSYETGGVAGRLPKSPERLHAELTQCVSAGFEAAKFGWGNNFAEADEERLEALRGAGPHLDLMVDVGCPAYWGPGWDVGTAIRAAEVLDRHQVYLMEEPLPPQDVDGHRRVREAAEVNVATGESLTLVDEFARLLDVGAVDVVQPDAAQLGVTQLVQIGRLAESAGIACMPHSPWSALTVAAHTQACLTLHNTDLIEYPSPFAFEAGSPTGAATAFLQTELVEYPPQLVDGRLLVSSMPGLGVGNFRPDALERLARRDLPGAGTWE